MKTKVVYHLVDGKKFKTYYRGDLASVTKRVKHILEYYVWIDYNIGRFNALIETEKVVKATMTYSNVKSHLITLNKYNDLFRVVK